MCGCGGGSGIAGTVVVLVVAKVVAMVDIGAVRQYTVVVQGESWLRVHDRNGEEGLNTSQRRTDYLNVAHLTGFARALAAATPFWTLVNVLSFNMVPVEHRAFVASIAAFVWNVYLASTAARGKAP